MTAALPKAPKGCHGAVRRPLLEVPFSTSCAKSRNRRSRNKIRASFRFRRFYRGEEQPEICCPANWHAIGHSEAPKPYSRNSRPARKDAGNSSVSVSRPHLPRVAGEPWQELREPRAPFQCRGRQGDENLPPEGREPSGPPPPRYEKRFPIITTMPIIPTIFINPINPEPTSRRFYAKHEG